MLGWSGIAAVIAVNCVIASYVLMAWNEKDDESSGEVNKNRNNLKLKTKERTD